MSARLASAQLMAQNAEATSCQQTAAAASAEHNAQKLKRQVADLQWELEESQQQLRSKMHHAEHKLKVCAYSKQHLLAAIDLSVGMSFANFASEVSAVDLPRDEWHRSCAQSHPSSTCFQHLLCMLCSTTKLHMEQRQSA